VLIFEGDPGDPGNVRGTFTDLSLVGPDGASWVANGMITSRYGLSDGWDYDAVASDRDVHIELVSGSSLITLTLDEDGPLAPTIEGTFRGPGLVGGQFTARRRLQ
jgi:hypothetical protein